MSKLILALYVLATSLGLILLKLGTVDGAPLKFSEGALQFNFRAASIAGIGLYGISFLLYISLISQYNLGYIVPLTTAFVYVVVFVASVVIFKETFTIAQIMGIVFILCGLFLLNWGTR